MSDLVLRHRPEPGGSGAGDLQCFGKGVTDVERHRSGTCFQPADVGAISSLAQRLLRSLRHVPARIERPAFTNPKQRLASVLRVYGVAPCSLMTRTRLTPLLTVLNRIGQRGGWKKTERRSNRTTVVWRMRRLSGMWRSCFDELIGEGERLDDIESSSPVSNIYGQLPCSPAAP